MIHFWLFIIRYCVSSSFFPVKCSLRSFFKLWWYSARKLLLSSSSSSSSSSLYIPVLKTSNSSSNRKTCYAGYYVNKNTPKRTCYFSNFFTSSSASNSILTSSPISWKGAQCLISENVSDSRRDFIVWCTAALAVFPSFRCW